MILLALTVHCNAQKKSSNDYVRVNLDDLKTLAAAADLGNDYARQNTVLKVQVVQKDSTIKAANQEIARLRDEIVLYDKYETIYLYVIGIMILFIFGAFIYFTRFRKTP